jgi:proline dehydrogenase
MKFISDPIVDIRKIQYKKEYDELFAKIQKSVKDSPEHHELLKDERRMHARTMRLISNNAYYFSRKRHSIFEQMERRGLFGDQPLTDAFLRRANRVNT